MIDPSKHFRLENGAVKWNMDRLEEFYDADAKWREPILPFINDEVGLHNWAVRFQPFYTDEYEVYIYCDDNLSFHKIVSIIQEKIKGVKFKSFTRQGTVEDYIAGR